MTENPDVGRFRRVALEHRVLLFIIVAGILISAKFIFADPHSGERLYLNVPFIGKTSLTSCVFRDLTGLPCPLCGITRSTVLIIRGDIIGGIRIHPLGPVVIIGSIFILVWAPVTSLKIIRSRETVKKSDAATNRWPIISLTIVILIAWMITLARHFRLIVW